MIENLFIGAISKTSGLIQQPSMLNVFNAAYNNWIFLQIKDISPLQHVSNLTTLNLKNNKVCVCIYVLGIN